MIEQDSSDVLLLVKYLGASVVDLTKLDFGMSARYAALSPDGSRVAFFSRILTDQPQEKPPDGNPHEQFGLYVSMTDRATPTLLANLRLLHDQNRPAWSPDSQLIAYEGAISQGLGIPFGHVFVVRTDGGSSPIDVSSDLLEAGSPSWAPDSKRLAFIGSGGGSTKTGVQVVNPDGKGRQRITPAAEADNIVTWSPDSSLIASWRQTDLDLSGDFYTMDSDGSGRRNITNHPANDFSAVIGSPPIAWSPDGRRIAFLSDRHNPADWDLFVMERDGSNSRRLSAPGHQPRFAEWSGDSQCILYYDRAGDLHIVDTDGLGAPARYDLEVK